MLSGAIDPGRVFDQAVALDDIAEGYAAMDRRESLKTIVTF
ncbi:Uncharacterised protein [Mycobacteroides abscessus]|nr:Uncharacterised protein [Mycobacteroides abscessus]